MGKKVISLMQQAGSALAFALWSQSVFANDLLAQVLESHIKDSLGSGSLCWSN